MPRKHDCDCAFSRRQQLALGRASAYHSEILFSQISHVLKSFVATKVLEQYRVPLIGLIVEKHVAFPPGVEQVLIGFRRLRAFNQVGVVAQNDRDDIQRTKKSISIFARWRKKITLR